MKFKLHLISNNSIDSKMWAVCGNNGIIDQTECGFQFDLNTFTVSSSIGLFRLFFVTSVCDLPQSIMITVIKIHCSRQYKLDYHVCFQDILDCVMRWYRLHTTYVTSKSEIEFHITCMFQNKLGRWISVVKANR